MRELTELLEMTFVSSTGMRVTIAQLRRGMHATRGGSGAHMVTLSRDRAAETTAWRAPSMLESITPARDRRGNPSSMAKQLFGTDGIRGIPGTYPLDDPTLERVGVALGEYLLAHAGVEGAPRRGF